MHTIRLDKALYVTETPNIDLYLTPLPKNPSCGAVQGIGINIIILEDMIPTVFKESSIDSSKFMYLNVCVVSNH